MSLFDYTAEKALQAPVSEKQHKLDTALDAIRSKYGNTAVVRGSFLKNKENAP